jgi:hypothetical protein
MSTKSTATVIITATHSIKQNALFNCYQAVLAAFIGKYPSPHFRENIRSERVQTTRASNYTCSVFVSNLVCFAWIVLFDADFDDTSYRLRWRIEFHLFPTLCFYDLCFCLCSPTFFFLFCYLPEIIVPTWVLRY